MPDIERRVRSDEIFDLLGSLVDRSLVAFDPETGRYSMLETVRQYSRERLMDAEDGEAVRARHAAYMRAFAEQVGRIEEDEAVIASMFLIDGELDNIRAAAQFLIAVGSGSDVTSMVRSLSTYWSRIGRFEDPASLLRLYLEHRMSGDMDEAEAEALLELARYEAMQQAPSSKDNADRALSQWTRLGNSKRMAECHNVLGNLSLRTDDVEDAERHLLTARDLTDDKILHGRVENNLGIICIRRRDWAGAREHLLKSRAASEETRVSTTLNLARVAVLEASLSEAKEILGEIAPLALRASSPYAFLNIFERMVELGPKIGRMEDVAYFSGVAASLREELKQRITVYESFTLEEAQELARETLGEEYDAIHDRGANAPWTDAAERAIEVIRAMP